MWNTIKSWFKKVKPMAVVDREEPVIKLPQKQRVGKSGQTKSYPHTAPVTTQTYGPTRHVDTSFQDLALTYLVLDSLADSTPVSQHTGRSEAVNIPEPTQSYSNESSSSSYSSYDDSSSSRYSSDSSSSYSSYDSGSSDSSSSYSSD